MSFLFCLSGPCTAWNLTIHEYRKEGDPAGPRLHTFCSRDTHKNFTLPWKMNTAVVRWVFLSSALCGSNRLSVSSRSYLLATFNDSFATVLGWEIVTYTVGWNTTVLCRRTIMLSQSPSLSRVTIHAPGKTEDWCSRDPLLSFSHKEIIRWLTIGHRSSRRLTMAIPLTTAVLLPPCNPRGVKKNMLNRRSS